VLLEGEVNLYLRLLKLLFLLPFVRRQALLDHGHIAFRVRPNDCDINLHLNNGRYLTFMDLGHPTCRRWCATGTAWLS